MPPNPLITQLVDALYQNQAVFRVITEFEENGEPVRPTVATENVDIQAIDGSPEGRSVGSPGDIRIQRDVPAIWQKATGVRTTEGWILIAGAASEGCPTNLITVGPGCLFETIQAGINFAATIPSDTVVQIAPGTYTEDITLEPGVALAGIENALVTINGTVTYPGDPGGEVRLQDLTIFPVGDDAIVVGGTGSLLLEADRMQINGNIVFTNTGAASSMVLRDSVVETPGPTAITWSGAPGSVFELDDTNVLVSDPSNNVAIDFNSGTLIAQYALISGLVDFADGTEGAFLFSRIDGADQEAMIVGAGAEVEMYIVDLHSNNASGSVIAGGGGAIVFSNLSLSGSAKDYSGAASTDESEAYDTAVGANWAGASPLTVKEALDRLAAAVSGLLGAPIP